MASAYTCGTTNSAGVGACHRDHGIDMDVAPTDERNEGAVVSIEVGAVQRREAAKYNEDGRQGRWCKALESLGEADVCRQYYASTTSFPKYGPPCAPRST